MKWEADKTISERYFDFVTNCVETKNTTSFKQSSDYNNIVGMSNKQQFDVWDEFFKENKISDIEYYKRNDISRPSEMYLSNNFEEISPSTMRYLYTAYDISNTFKNIKDVLEIGIGYGGLCYILSKMLNVNKYKLVDVDVVKQFADMYLNNLHNKTHMTEHDGVSDLLISEFCFSEFDDEYMENFYQTYFTKTKNIYLVMNLHDINRKQFWKDRIEQDFNLVEKDEFPKTQWPNYVWYGSRR